MTMNGTWGYKSYDNKWKSTETLIHNLVDIASKGGNYLLNVGPTDKGEFPQGSIDGLKGIGAWMKVNSESIYGTRPWKIFGEGPAQQTAAQLSAQGFNEGKGKPFTGEDIRFTTKGDTLYATALGWPENNKLVIKSLAKDSQYFPKEIQKLEWVPTKQSLTFERNENGLIVSLPEKTSDELTYANVIKVLS